MFIRNLIHRSVAKQLLATMVVAAVALVIPLNAQSAPFSLGIVAAGDLAGSHSSSSSVRDINLDVKRKLSFGGGLVFDVPVADMLSLGTGAIYIYRKYGLSTPFASVERHVPTIFVPLEMKIWLFNVLHFGLGGFAGVGVGSASDEVNFRGGSLQLAGTPNHERFDYGFTGSVGVLIPVKERTGILLGGRYLYGMNNGSRTDGYSEYLRDIMFTAGLNISFL